MNFYEEMKPKLNSDCYIDVNFNFWMDTPKGDPDSRSTTLRKYHKLLWNKPLPNGECFTLDDSVKGVYLYHRSKLGEFFLSSDTVIPMFMKKKEVRDMIKNLPDEKLFWFMQKQKEFGWLGRTIGGMMIFPGNKINGHYTINQARGCTHKISDRFDLTMECIRRYYGNKSSPLNDTLKRYDNFFKLFVDFKGYVEFFLLQDITNGNFTTVKLFTPTIDLENNTKPYPKNIDAYDGYRKCALEFLRKRNNRIFKSYNMKLE